MLILFSVFMNSLFAQDSIQKLNKSIFSELIIDKGWSVEDSTQKKDYEMMVVVISKDSCLIAYVSWIEAIVTHSCFYDLKIENNFFEIEITKCQERSEMSYIYGYLVRQDHLEIIFSEKRLRMNAELLNEKEWLNFTKIEE